MKAWEQKPFKKLIKNWKTHKHRLFVEKTSWLIKVWRDCYAFRIEFQSQAPENTFLLLLNNKFQVYSSSTSYFSFRFFCINSKFCGSKKSFPWRLKQFSHLIFVFWFGNFSLTMGNWIENFFSLSYTVSILICAE